MAATDAEEVRASTSTSTSTSTKTTEPTTDEDKGGEEHALSDDLSAGTRAELDALADRVLRKIGTSDVQPLHDDFEALWHATRPSKSKKSKSKSDNKGASGSGSGSGSDRHETARAAAAAVLRRRREARELTKGHGKP